MTEIEKLKHTLYANSRISIDFFTYLPNVLASYGSYTVEMNPMIMIRWVDRSGQSDYRGTFYKVTTKNLYKTMKFFNDLVEWFYFEDLKDLFLEDENGELLFNADYRNLSKTLGNPIKENNGVITAIPSIVLSQEKKEEGVNLFINKKTQVVPLTRYEVEEIRDVLCNFSFTQEVSCMLQSITFAIQSGRLETDIVRFRDKTGKYMGSKTKISTPFDTKS